jgi:MOSC domain-containing protein YiiM
VTAGRVDSSSVGDPARFLSLDALERGLAGLGPAPAAEGRVALVVSRREGGRREILARAPFSPEGGVPGDAWARHTGRDPEQQIAVMQADVAALIANGQPLTLFGDNLFLELDLGAASLPTGSRVRVGRAVLEVTPHPHNGCRKFEARFGNGALRFVAGNERRDRNLRGIYMRVVEPGDVAAGDAARVVSRPAAQRPA